MFYNRHCDLLKYPILVNMHDLNKLFEKNINNNTYQRDIVSSVFCNKLNYFDNYFC